MKQLSAFTENYEIKKSKTGVNNYRAEIVSRFEKRINASRRAAGYKPYTSAHIASKMAHIKPESVLEDFYNDCTRKRSFSAYWEWALNPKNCK